MIRSADEVIRVVSRRKGLKAISVDLFDTLVFRQTFEPTDVFYLQYERLQTERLIGSSAEEWVTLRKGVEHRLSRAAEPGEIHLADVYREIQAANHWSDQQAALALQIELSVEADVVRPNEGLVKALKILHNGGLHIIVQTDTCLPHRFIRSILDGFMDFSYELRCSSETGFPKRSGLAFDQLYRDFKRSIIHFGDNFAVDVDMARRHRVEAHHIEWKRSSLINNAVQREYAKALGARTVSTPPEEDIDQGISHLAFRWSFVLADFMLAAREYADSIGATDIWLLSRDCETIASVTDDIPDFFGSRNVKYVLCSRSACLPIVALLDQERFNSWGYDIDEDTLRTGEPAICYYNSQIESNSRRILVVDTGWKGRLQLALSLAMPQVEIFGFYFSMEPIAEPRAVEKSSTFLPWDLRIFSQPVIEALAGFVEPSCKKFVIGKDGAAVPLYKADSSDRSPSAYCEALRAQTAKLLMGISPVEISSSARLSARSRAVEQICAYPDQAVINAFRGWGIGFDVDSNDCLELLSGGSASRIDRLLGRAVDDILWPRGAIWSVISSPTLVKLIYRLDDQTHRARQVLKGWRVGRIRMGGKIGQSLEGPY
jgi:FMN phosphatase YigB (HAD superfamily)